MFERWTQENLFRYMRQHFALDASVTYAAEPADPDRTVPNPERKAVWKQLAEGHAWNWPGPATIARGSGRQCGVSRSSTPS